jgi:hypothetical protein
VLEVGAALTSPDAFLSGKEGEGLLPGRFPNGEEEDDEPLLDEPLLPKGDDELEPDELPLLPNGDDEPELDGLLPNGFGAVLPEAADWLE